MKTIIFTIILLTIAYLTYTLWFELGRAPKAGDLSQHAHAPQYNNGLFQNQIETPTKTGDISTSDMIREMLFPSSKSRKPNAAIPSEHNSLAELSQQASSITWFGHSSYLLNFNGFTVLVDPVMSGHSAPLPFLVNSFKGTDVYSVQDLPEIDVLLITHDHYDHLDYETVSALKSKAKQVIVPLGVGEHLRFWGYDANKITELNWHESKRVGTFIFTATPARHFSGRGLTRNNTLWASYVLKSDQHSIYIGGDSGYGPHFKEIGAQYGPFNLAMLESGQYSENWRYIHMMPEETVQAALDLSADVLFPVHWGKFVLSLHDWNEPINRVVKAAEAQQQKLFTPKIGHVTHLSEIKNGLNPWWLDIPTQ